MTFKNLSALVSLSLLLLAGTASAQTITFQFSGLVTYGSPLGVPPGTAVVGTFTYDVDTPTGGQTKNYAYYQIQSPSAMTIKFGGHTVIADTLGIALMNNTKSNVGDLVDVNGASPVLDGTTLSSGDAGFRIASAANQNTALKSTKLPRKFKIDKFNAGPSMNYGYLQMDGGPTGMLLEFSMDSIDVINSVKK